MANLKNFRSKIIMESEQKGAQAFNKIGGNLQKATKAAGRFVAVAAPIAAGAIFTTSLRQSARFQQSIADLSAITGAAGRDLQFLSEQSLRLGQNSTFSSAQAAEAFKLVASAKPDLLDNAAALSETTRQTLLLAEAAGTQLPEAASIVGTSLNQFGAGADQAGRFVNVLAAGAQRGASEVTDTANALDKAGVVARSAGLSFELTNAAIQTLAASGVKGQVAGTQLRGVLIRLSSQARDEFNPEVVGLAEALENLGEANLSTAEKAKLFGQENIVSANILIDQVDEVRRYEEALTGTDTALEQAATRTDTLQGDTKGLGSAFEALSIRMGDKLNPVSRQFVQNLTDIINAFADTTEASQGAARGFDFLEESMDFVGTTAFAIKQIFVSLGEIVGAVFASIAQAMEGEFRSAIDTLKEGVADARDNMTQIAEVQLRLEKQNRALITTADERVEKERALTKAYQDQAEVIETVIEKTEGLATPTAGSQAEEAAAQKRREALEHQVETVRQASLMEEQVLVEKYQRQAEIIQTGIQSEIIQQSEANTVLLALAQDFSDKLLTIRQKNLSDIEKFTSMSTKKQTEFVISEGIRMTQGVAQNSKTMFKINKIAAIAQATINTGRAISEALAAYPPPLSFAMAALAGAAGVAQVQAIKSTSFTGAGGGTTPSAAGTTPVVNDQPTAPTLPAPSGGGPGAGQQISINIDGLPESGLMSTEAVRELMMSIDEQLGDGVKLGVAGEET